MATNYKISELPSVSTISGSDACVLVSDGTDHQFAMSLLLQYVGRNIHTGATLSFGQQIPENSMGNNGDVFIHTTTGVMAQKNTGTWTIMYSPDLAPVTTGGNSILYGLGIPSYLTGNEGDTYISTSTGVFYRKAGSQWNQVFSMQSGPAGQAGIKGDTGATGANGNTILTGITNPDNQHTGKDGDFYLDTHTYTLYGPKANGAWSTGIELIQTPQQPVVLDFPAGTSVPILIANYQLNYTAYTDYPTLALYEVAGSNLLKERNDVQLVRQFSNGKLSAVIIDVPGNTDAKLTSHLKLIIKP